MLNSKLMEHLRTRNSESIEHFNGHLAAKIHFDIAFSDSFS